MSIQELSEDDFNLSGCLHDGTLESLTSDPLARSIVIVVDAGYIWNFHNYPADTRFHLMLGNVREAIAFGFMGWPGDLIIPADASWEESQKLRTEFYERGRLQSIDWTALMEKLSGSEDYEISKASFRNNGDKVTLRLDVTNYEDDYPTLEITAETLALSLNGDQPLSIDEFLSLGKAYWDAFSKRTA